MIFSNFLSTAARLELECCVRRQREDHGTARRAHAILGARPAPEVADCLYLDDDTVRNWYKAYQRESLGGSGTGWLARRVIADDDRPGGTWLEERFCRSAREVWAQIATQFGLALLPLRLLETATSSDTLNIANPNRSPMWRKKQPYYRPRCDS